MLRPRRTSAKLLIGLSRHCTDDVPDTTNHSIPSRLCEAGFKAFPSRPGRQDRDLGNLRRGWPRRFVTISIVDD